MMLRSVISFHALGTCRRRLCGSRYGNISGRPLAKALPKPILGSSCMSSTTAQQPVTAASYAKEMSLKDGSESSLESGDGACPKLNCDRGDVIFANRNSRQLMRALLSLQCCSHSILVRNSMKVWSFHVRNILFILNGLSIYVNDRKYVGQNVHRGCTLSDTIRHPSASLRDGV